MFIYQRTQRSNFQHVLDHRKNKRVPEKHLHLLYWLRQRFWLCGSQQTGKCLKRWKYQTTLVASWEICIHVKKQQLQLDREQQTGSKLGNEYVKTVYCHPAYLTYMQSTSCDMPGWMKHKLESRLMGEISITSYMQMTSHLWQKLKKSKRASWGYQTVTVSGMKDANIFLFILFMGFSRQDYWSCLPSLDESGRGKWKSWLKTQHSKN